MAVRRQCNRYKSEPYGLNFQTVLKKAKAFYRSVGVFEIYQTSSGQWHASRETLEPFIKHEGTITYKFDGKWSEVK